MRGELLENIVPCTKIHKGQSGSIRKTNGNIQISKPHIAVNAQNTLPFPSQGDCDTGADGSFTRSTLTGQKSNGFTHEMYASCNLLLPYYKGITHKNQEENRKKWYIFLQNQQKICHFRGVTSPGSPKEGTEETLFIKYIQKKTQIPLDFFGRLRYDRLALR
jgi:hypothetical protein